MREVEGKGRDMELGRGIERGWWERWREGMMGGG